MPWAEECAEWIKPYLDQIAFGIDLNASTGPSILGHDQVPNLCHDNGEFYTSKENRALDTEENNHDHLNYDQVYAEFDAQIQKYIQLIGKVPDYIHNHAYGTETTAEASRALAKKYHRPLTGSVMRQLNLKAAGMGWYIFGSPEQQLQEDPIFYITSDHDHLLDSEYGYIISHCGYADADLFKLSSFNTCRVKDLECMTSDAVKNWIKENHIELISFKDIPENWYE
jgi:predicted glycoside hydrolase/deacetylase ChbG (UPF0249 family)